MSPNKILRKIIILVLVFIMSAANIAAVVSDNDGSAFITKTEYDSLRSNFQSQIDSYNTNIDSKIDSAISSYLAGIKVDVASTNLFDNYVSTNGYKPKFYNSIPGVGKSTQKMGLSLGATRQEAYKIFSNLIYNLNHYVATHKGFQDDAVLSFGNPPWSASYSTWTMVWMRKQYDRRVAGSVRTGGALENFSYWSSSTTRRSAKRSVSSYASKTQIGDGEGWIFQLIGGDPVLKYYNSELYPQLNIETIVHKYKDFAQLTASYYTSDNGKADSAESEVSISRKTAFGYWEDGTKPEKTDESNKTYSNYNITRHEVKTSDKWISNIIAKDTDTTVYALAEDAGVKAESTQAEFQSGNIYFYDIYYRGDGGHLQKNNLGIVKVKYYPVTFDMQKKKINDFTIPDLKSLVGESVRHGEGFPIAKINGDDSDVTIKIKFTSTSGNIVYKISNGKLKDGNFISSNMKLAEGTSTSGREVVVNASKMKKGDIIYVNCYSTTNNAVATIDSVTLSK